MISSSTSFLSKTTSPTHRFLYQFTSSVIWFPVVISACMSIYVAGASRQGIQWFSPTHNPFLCLQLTAGAGATLLSIYLSRLEGARNNQKNQHQQNQNGFASDSSSSELAEIFLKPPKPVILLAATCWSFYSALITRQRWHFREWRYILSAQAPLVALFGVYLSL